MELASKLYLNEVDILKLLHSLHAPRKLINSTKGQEGSAHVESIITPQGELVVSELGQVNDTTRGQGSAHVESIITPQGEVVMLELDTTRGQGSAHMESMTSQGEPLISTIHTISPGNYHLSSTQ